MTARLLTLVMTLHLGRMALAVRDAACRVSDRWLDVKMCTAWWYGWRIASPEARDRARMHGEVFSLTGVYLTGWPGRYMAEFIDGEENARYRGRVR